MPKNHNNVVNTCLKKYIEAQKISKVKNIFYSYNNRIEISHKDEEDDEGPGYDSDDDDGLGGMPGKGGKKPGHGGKKPGNGGKGPGDDDDDDDDGLGGIPSKGGKKPGYGGKKPGKGGKAPGDDSDDDDGSSGLPDNGGKKPGHGGKKPGKGGKNPGDNSDDDDGLGGLPGKGGKKPGHGGKKSGKGGKGPGDDSDDGDGLGGLPGKGGKKPGHGGKKPGKGGKEPRDDSDDDDGLDDDGYETDEKDEEYNFLKEKEKITLIEDTEETYQEKRKFFENLTFKTYIEQRLTRKFLKYFKFTTRTRILFNFFKHCYSHPRMPKNHNKVVNTCLKKYIETRKISKVKNIFYTYNKRIEISQKDEEVDEGPGYDSDDDNGLGGMPGKDGKKPGHGGRKPGKGGKRPRDDSDDDDDVEDDVDGMSGKPSEGGQTPRHGRRPGKGGKRSGDYSNDDDDDGDNDDDLEGMSGKPSNGGKKPGQGGNKTGKGGKGLKDDDDDDDGDDDDDDDDDDLTGMPGKRGKGGKKPRNGKKRPGDDDDDDDNDNLDEMSGKPGKGGKKFGHGENMSVNDLSVKENFRKERKEIRMIRDNQKIYEKKRKFLKNLSFKIYKSTKFIEFHKYFKFRVRTKLLFNFIKYCYRHRKMPRNHNSVINKCLRKYIKIKKLNNIKRIYYSYNKEISESRADTNAGRENDYGRDHQTPANDDDDDDENDNQMNKDRDQRNDHYVKKMFKREKKDIKMVKDNEKTYQIKRNFLKNLTYKTYKSEKIYEFNKYFKFSVRTKILFNFIKFCYRHRRMPKNHNRIINICLKKYIKIKEISYVKNIYSTYNASIIKSHTENGAGQKNDYNRGSEEYDEDENETENFFKEKNEISEASEIKDDEELYREKRKLLKNLTFQVYRKDKYVRKYFYRCFKFQVKTRILFRFLKYSYRYKRMPKNHNKILNRCLLEYTKLRNIKRFKVLYSLYDYFSSKRKESKYRDNNQNDYEEDSTENSGYNSNGSEDDDLENDFQSDMESQSDEADSGSLMNTDEDEDNQDSNNGKSSNLNQCKNDPQKNEFSETDDYQSNEDFETESSDSMEENSSY